MIPGKRNITLYRGDTRRLDIKLSRKYTNEQGVEVVEPIDLTGHTFHSEIRVDANSNIVEAEFTPEIVDAENGHVVLTLPPSESSNLNMPQMHWDVQSEDTDGFTQTWLYGTVTVMFDVTRPGE